MLKSTRRLVLLAMVAATAACSSTTPAAETVPAPASGSTAPASTTASASGTPAAAPSSAASSAATQPFAVKVNVEDGRDDVPVDTLITVSATGGQVGKVSVTTTASGKNAVTDITGKIDDKGRWVADNRLDPSSSYTVTATGTAADGTTKTTKFTFSTMALSRSEEVFPTLTPVQGGPFGVAQPVVVTFDLPVKNKAAFEKAMTVTSVPAQEGSWGWLNDKTVHWRPKTYWQPGTRVTLDARLNGVNAGNGNYGQLNRTLDLQIGKSQHGLVDIAKHTVTWTRDGKKVLSFPMTAGKPGFTTRSGTKVVMEKAENITMASETTGIARDSAEGYEVHVAYALRVTSSGEFIHSAPWNAGNFGVRNASHGCVGMSTDTMYELYTTAQIGDPVKFVGSDRELEDGNGWSDWNMSWQQWQKKSALH